MKISKDYYFGPYSIEFFQGSFCEFWTYNIWNSKNPNCKYYSRNCGITIIPFENPFKYFWFSNDWGSYQNKRFSFSIGVFSMFIDYYAEEKND